MTRARGKEPFLIQYLNFNVSHISGTVKGAEVDRIYVGTFMTSLEMAGVSITLIHLNEERNKYLGIYLLRS